MVVSLLAGVRTEEARALTWADVDLEATVAVYRSVRAKGDIKTRKSRCLLKLPRHGGAGQPVVVAPRYGHPQPG